MSTLFVNKKDTIMVDTKKTRKPQPKRGKPVIISEDVPQEDVVVDTQPVCKTQEVPTELKTPKDVLVLLGAGGCTNEALKAISESKVPKVNLLAGKLITYEQGVIGPNITPSAIARKNFDLLNTFKFVLSIENKEEFTVCFTLLNVVFSTKCGHGEAFSEIMCHRHDTDPVWNTRDLTTYQRLVTMFDTIAAPATRKAKLKTIPFSSWLRADELSISEEAVTRIKDFYK